MAHESTSLVPRTPRGSASRWMSCPLRAPPTRHRGQPREPHKKRRSAPRPRPRVTHWRFSLFESATRSRPVHHGGSKKVAEIISGDFPVLSNVAKVKGISVPRIVVAWLRHLSPVMVALPGATRRESAADSVLAAQGKLSAEEVTAITVGLPASEPRRVELDARPPRRAH